MPLTFLKNERGIFRNVTTTTGIGNYVGWWTSLVTGDFDNDGDIDFLAGNTGENSFYQASEKYPVYVTAKDFDNNGSFDAFPSLYLPDSTGDRKEYPAQTRDDAIKQMVSLRTKFQNYKKYANASMEDVLSPEQRKGALRLSANTMNSCYIRNDGNGKFSLSLLPVEAQVSVLNGMVVDDFNGDGNLDVAINGNDFGGEVTNGRFDALNGLVLVGDGAGNFKALSILQSGIFIPGDGKALVKLTNNKGEYLVAASQNRGPLEIFKLKTASLNVPLLLGDSYAMVQLQNGKTQKQEFNFGSSFLSQSARFMHITPAVKSITVVNGKGEKRTIDLNTQKKM